MDNISFVLIALTSAVVSVLYDFIKKLISKNSGAGKIIVKLPSGRNYEIDSPKENEQMFNNMLRSLVYSTDFTNIHETDKVNLLNDVVLPSVLPFRKLNDKKNISIEIENNIETLPAIKADKEAMQQVLFNLLDNAVKYSIPGRIIKIGGRAIGKSIELSITNVSNLQLHPDELGNIFEQGFRGREAVLKDRTGSGLGLFVAKNLVEAQHGQISTQSHGQLFTTKISLPLETAS